MVVPTLNQCFLLTNHVFRRLNLVFLSFSVYDIGARRIFSDCSKLQSVIFAEHSSIKTINFCRFNKCTSLQFINIPTTITTIEYLQVIVISQQVRLDRNAFKNCPLLSTILEEHGTDYMKGRFDDLPIHQSCYKLASKIPTVLIPASSTTTILYKTMAQFCYKQISWV